MTNKMYDSIRKVFLFLPVSLLLAACSQDEAMEQGTALPEGKYPLEIASVTMSAEVSSQPWGANAPQTRVSENTDRNSSVWVSGDIIFAQIGNDNTNRGTYSVNAVEGDIFLNPIERIYWKSTTPQIVKGWYPSVGETIDLSQQYDEYYGLAYALYAETKTVNYQTRDITLPFEHKLAKVRVVLKGNQTEKVTDVKIYTYKGCILGADGTLTASDTQDYIPMVETTYDGMKCWEANVVPTESVGNDYKILKFSVKNKETGEVIDGELDDGGIAPLKGKVNTITLTVGKTVTEIEDGKEITEPGDYIITGDITKGITLNGDDIKLTLDNVTANIGNAIQVKGGSPTLIVKGTNNNFNGDGAGILISPNASVTIQGATDNAADSKLTIKAGSSNQPGIGCANESNCKNITIKNVTLDVTGGSYSFDGGAAIGTAGEWGSSVNDY